MGNDIKEIKKIGEKKVGADRYVGGLNRREGIRNRHKIQISIGRFRRMNNLQ